MKRTQALRARAGSSSTTRAILGVAFALSCVATSAPAQAKHYGGTVILPVAHPTVARSAYSLAGFTNGLAGYVIELSPSVDAGSPYVIEDETGGPGTDFDVWWYPDLDFGTSPCPFSGEVQTGSNRQAGTVLCDAEYAIVVLFSGALAEFDLTV